MEVEAEDVVGGPEDVETADDEVAEVTELVDTDELEELVEDVELAFWLARYTPAAAIIIITTTIRATTVRAIPTFPTFILVFNLSFVRI